MRGLQVKGLALGALTANFEVASGECVALRGPSGSGKTRVLRAIADLDPADGDVCSGEVARDQVDAPAWRKRVVYVAAEPGWWSDLVAEHFHTWPPGDLLGLDARIGGKPLAQLSTGERQRLALLRALEAQPDVLLLDEPTSALDRPATLAVEAMLLRRLESGLAILWATHDEAQVRRVASRALHIDHSSLREESW